MPLVLGSLASGFLRDAHYERNPVTGIWERCTLLEAARTNGWTRSEELGDAVWTKARSSISANAVVAPDGATTADKLIEDTTATQTHYVGRTPPAMTDSTLQSFSVSAKAGERTWVYLRTVDKTNTSLFSWVDLATGVTGTIAAGHSVYVRSEGNGWYRIELAWNCGTGGITPNAIVGLAPSDNVSLYTGDGSSGAYLWGMQFEADQDWPSSYIATVASTVTRSSDQLYLPVDIAPQEMTVYARLFPRRLTTATHRIWEISSTSSTDPRLLTWYGSGRYRFMHDTGSFVESLGDVMAVPIGSVVEFRSVLHSDGSVELGQSVDEAAEVVGARSAALTLSSAWAGSPPRLWLNSIGTSSINQGAYTHLLVEPGVLTLDQCRALAQLPLAA